MASVTLPRITPAQAAFVVGICQTLPLQAVLDALTDVVVVDILAGYRCSRLKARTRRSKGKTQEFGGKMN